LLQITRTTPWRLMTLQSLHIRLTEALTFTLSYLLVFLLFLLEAIHDPTPGGVGGSHLDLYPIPSKETQVVAANPPRAVGQDLVSVLEGDSKKSIGQRFDDRAENHHLLLSRHGANHRRERTS
jgi:hypothetical protein